MDIIVAVDENWGIGYQGGLLASIPEDMKFFRQKTQGKIVVMGRGTLQSLPGGEPLKNRTNIILSSNASLKAGGAVVCDSMEKLFACIKNYNSDDVFIIGGEKIYAQLLPFCNKAYVTKIYKSFPADKFFPNIDSLGNWRVAGQSDEKAYNGINYRFLTYENTRPAKI